MSDKKEKILIVEDEAPLLNVLDKKFKQEGYETILAKDGRKGLEMAKSEQPDLILLDILMPKMDGLEMLKRLRASVDGGRDIPVFCLTNLSEMENISEAVQIGVSGYLVKTDWKLDEVVKKVKEKLNEAHEE